MNVIDKISKKYERELPDFKVGDIVKVSLKVVEGSKTRIQNFEGTVIRKRGCGTDASFTVLKKSKGSHDTVEKTFPLYSPIIDKLKVVKLKGAKRAKLYHLRRDKK